MSNQSYCDCDPNHRREKFKYTVKEYQEKRTCRQEMKVCKACDKLKEMPIVRYWCDECFYIAHGWC